MIVRRQAARQGLVESRTPAEAGGRGLWLLDLFVGGGEAIE